jgi:hypothetical protein
MSKIRTAFSTLLIDDAESPARAAGVQDESEDTTSCTRAGLCLTKLLQEWMIALRISGFLCEMYQNAQRSYNMNTLTGWYTGW